MIMAAGMALVKPCVESREPGTPTPALFSKEEKRNTLLPT
jgi:hypothetical protein